MFLVAVHLPPDNIYKVFYCFASVIPVSGIYSIISLFISGLLLNVFRPILRENASAVPYNGGNYSYLLNFTAKSFAIVAAAITVLDAITTVSTILYQIDVRLWFQLEVQVDISPVKLNYHSLRRYCPSLFSSCSPESVFLEFENQVDSHWLL